MVLHLARCLYRPPIRHTSAVISRNDQLVCDHRVCVIVFTCLRAGNVSATQQQCRHRAAVFLPLLCRLRRHLRVYYCFSFGTKSVQSKENTVKSTDLADCCADFLLFRIQFGARARIVQFTLSLLFFISLLSILTHLQFNLK